VSGHNPPLTCKQVKDALKTLGFELRPAKSGTSHEHYVGTFRGKFRKVTVDCPKAPFGHDLIGAMANQGGLTKKELYAAVKGEAPKKWPN
jgi:hypothetical protein